MLIINVMDKIFNQSKKLLSSVLIFWLVFGVFVLDNQVAYAASLTSVSDSMSSIKASTASNHTIIFTTPSGIANGSTTVITFTGWSSLLIGTSSIDILVGNSSTTATQQVVASSSSAGANVWGFATSSNVLTLTAPTSGTVPTPGQVVIIKIGTNATSSIQGTQQITNPAAGSYTPTIGGNMLDSGSFTVNIVANDTVSISATVAQTITFSLSTTTLYFGTLSSVSSKYASSTGVNGDSATTTAAHNLQINTNAPYGYTISIQGDTLRSQQNPNDVITAIGAVSASPAAGTAQFGLFSTSTGGTGASIDSTFGTFGRYGFDASTSTAVTFATGNVPTNTTTYNMYYLANITSLQAAGTYTTNVTYVSTANF
jgi:hypothetical protein